MVRLDWDDNVRSVLQLELAHPRGGYADVFPEMCWKWWADKKEDGWRESLQLGRTTNWLVGRNRKDKLKGVDKAGDFMVQELPGWLEKGFPGYEGTMFDGEYLWPGHGASKISHAKASGKERELRHVVFDCLFSPSEGDIRQLAYRDRLAEAKRLVDKLGSPNIRMVETFKDLTPAKVQEFWDMGWEGLVFKNPDTKYDEGAPDCWYKLKSSVPCDVFIIGVSEHRTGGSPKRGIKPKPTGKAAMFEVAMFDGKKIHRVGMMGHLEEEDQKRGLKEFHEKYEMKVVEATVSGWDGDRFRFMRFSKWRPDKTPRDCRMEEQIGGRKAPALEAARQLV